MHIIYITKLWKGQFLSVRDNHLLKGSYSGGLIVRHNNKEMIISAEDCKEKYLSKIEIGLKMQSKYGKAKPYYLIDFRWHPTEEEHRQGVLL